jgi:hypothetical protein
MQDRKAVEVMSRAPRAQDAKYDEERPMLIELAYDGSDSRALWTLVRAIETAISKGCAVLVRGWELGPSLKFTRDDIRLYRPTIPQEVVVQGSYQSFVISHSSNTNIRHWPF